MCSVISMLDTTLVPLLIYDFAAILFYARYCVNDIYNLGSHLLFRDSVPVWNSMPVQIVWLNVLEVPVGKIKTRDCYTSKGNYNTC